MRYGHWLALEQGRAEEAPELSGEHVLAPYPRRYECVEALQRGLGEWLQFDNTERRHLGWTYLN